MVNPGICSPLVMAFFKYPHGLLRVDMLRGDRNNSDQFFLEPTQSLELESEFVKRALWNRALVHVG